MQRELKSERKRQGCGSGSAWIRIYFLHFLQGKSRENARKLVIKIGILLGTIFTINLDQLHDFFYTFEHFFYFQLQKALEKAIFHIRWLQISIKKAAGYGSALRKTAGSGSAKMNADPQPWKARSLSLQGRGAAALVALQPFLPPPPGYARVSIRSIPFRYTLTHTVPMVSVVDPDPHGSEPFGRIRIRSNGPVPDPTIKSHKSYRYKKYNKLNRFFCNIGTR